MKKISKHIYEVDYDLYDYNLANLVCDQYYKYHPKEGAQGGCSAVRSGNLFGRNYDFHYTDNVEFIVHTKGIRGRHSTLGVSYIPDIMTKNMKNGLTRLLTVPNFFLIPFATVDGINDAGVCACVNVVPDDHGLTLGSNPGKKDLCTIPIVRLILDYADTADDALDLLSVRNIYAPHSNELSFEMHFMINDSKHNYVVEFVNNKMVVMENKPIMTNFHLADDGKYSNLAFGIERYDIIKGHYPDITDVNSMHEALKDAWYTKAYSWDTKPFWYSEYFEEGFDINTDHNNPDFIAHIDKQVQQNKQRTYKDELWWTVHTSVYDIQNKTLSYKAREEDKEYIFKLTDDWDK